MSSRHGRQRLRAVADLTVVLIVDRRRERGSRSLRAILEQSAVKRLEVLLFDLAVGICSPLDESRHPAVTVIPAHRPSSLGALRLQAFQEAHSPWVAFVEEHAQPLPGWADAILARIDEGKWAGIGGEMRNLRRRSRMGEAFYVMNFGHCSAPADGGPTALLAGNNSAYSRDVVLGLGGDLPNLLEMEPLLNWRLAEQGHALVIEPAARMLHANEPGLLAFVEANFVFSRLFGALRGDAQGWSDTTRVVWALSAPVLPIIRLVRLLRFAAMKRPSTLASILWSLPALLLAQYASALGQSLGLLFGEGRSPQEFLALDLNSAREERPA